MTDRKKPGDGGCNMQTSSLPIPQIPWPMDHPRSCQKCESFTCALQLATEDLKKTRSLDCDVVSVYQEYLNQDGSIKNVKDNFIEDIYLSSAGIRVARVAWLRYFGFFLIKVK